uniref:Uncharacterized protein n=1 Tax=Anopheles dirus TaxID=7168 RepID=A0A182NWD7_9DIPT
MATIARHTSFEKPSDEMLSTESFVVDYGRRRSSRLEQVVPTRQTHPVAMLSWDGHNPS